MYNAEEFFKDFEEDACFHIKEFAEKYTPLSSEKRQACNDFATEFLEKLDFQGDIKNTAAVISVSMHIEWMMPLKFFPSRYSQVSLFVP